MNDLPIFPASQEFLALWPLWLLLVVLAGIFILSEVMQRQTTRWNRMKRRQELMFLESQRGYREGHE
jgi:hypothetical protein